MELETCRNTDTVMTARVLYADFYQMLVCDCATNQEVIVHANNAHCFPRNECVCIRYNGAMTRSIPPQITATCITRYQEH